MNIKQLIEKAIKGEALTEEEKVALAAFDPDAMAAAARKKAEATTLAAQAEQATLAESLKAAQAKLDEAALSGKSDVEKLQAQLDRAAADVSEKNEAIAGLHASQKAADRAGKMNGLLSKAGISFVKGVDPELMQSAARDVLGTLSDDQLDNPVTVATMLESFKQANAAVIVDPTGGGTGAPANEGTGAPSNGGAQSITEAELLNRALNGNIDDVEKQLKSLGEANTAGQLEIAS